MRIMLFCGAENMKTTFSTWTTLLASYFHDFTISPLIGLNDRENYEKLLSKTSRVNSNIFVDPVYLRSPNMRLINLFNLRILLNDFSSIFNVLTRSKPKVVICFYVLHAYPLAILKRIFGFSLCVVAMGSDINIDNSFVQRLSKRFIFYNCDAIFANSYEMKERIEKEYGCSVMAIPSSADMSFFRSLGSSSLLRRKWGIERSSRVIISVCRLVKEKGVDVLIRSLHLLDLTGVKLLVVGDGSEEKALRQLSSELGLKQKVEFLGFRSREELLELYNIADLFVLSSCSEGLPRALIEAMACGCVPIATNVGDVSRIVKHGFNGFIIKYGDYEELAQRIREMLSYSKEELKLFQHRAEDAVREGYDSEKWIKKMLDTSICDEAESR